VKDLKRQVAVLGNLRRLHLQSAGLLRHDADLAQRDRHAVFDRQRSAVDVEGISKLRQRGSWSERATDRNPRSIDCRLRRRALEDARALRRGRQLEDQRLRRLHRHARRIDDVEQNEHIQRFVAHLEDEARAVTENDHAGLGLALREALVFTCALLHLRIGRHQRDPDSTRRRNAELLRFQPLAIDHGGCFDSAADGQAGELRPACFVGDARKRLWAAGELDRLIGNHVRHRAADDAHRDRACCKVADRKRDTRHLLGVGHLCTGQTLAASRTRRRQQSHEGDDERSEGTGPSHDVITWSDVPHRLQNAAS
jgi:hypothetical protein